ncbi:MAG TPA: glycosyltransferase [Candidatus Moranbacteria bacterium]|nr:glycosyltransferase [Candidatus Moranbacteria bacterium]
MRISIVTPVYNAGKYVEEAVKSALAQEEVAEVILVEDGSLDGSLEVCKKLADKYEKVFLYQHPNGENRGAGETRNLAIEKSTCEFVAFLDADDFYLLGRFKNAKKIFEARPEVDGVYEAIGTKFDNSEIEEKWKKNRWDLILTLKQKVKPEKLFEFLVLAKQGIFSIDGLVVKKEALKKIGLFNTKLRISQDTHMYLKLAAICTLVPGDIKNPVSMRRIHAGNRITKVDKNELYRYHHDLWKSLHEWSRNTQMNFSKKVIIEYMNFYYEILIREKKNLNNINYNILLSLLKYSIKKPFSHTLMLMEKFLFYLFKSII